VKLSDTEGDAEAERSTAAAAEVSAERMWEEESGRSVFA
jgi:hypothetical protein